MAEQQDEINDLKALVHTLMTKFSEVKSERDKLKDEMAHLKIELGNEKLRVVDLEQKCQAQSSLRLSDLSLEDAKSNRDNLSKLLREVDKCIALLNK